MEVEKLKIDSILVFLSFFLFFLIMFVFFFIPSETVLSPTITVTTSRNFDFASNELIETRFHEIFNLFTKNVIKSSPD